MRGGERSTRPWFARPAVLLVALLVLAVLVAAGTVVGLARTGRLPAGLPGARAPASPAPSPSARPTPPPAPAVLPPETAGGGGSSPGTPVPDLTASGVGRLLVDRDLGPRPGAFVLDTTTGQVLLGRDDTRPRRPASVAKLATAAAALLTLGPDARLRTRTVAGTTPGAVVVVGAGDVTLSSRAPRPGTYPRRATLRDLAAATATRLRAQGVTTVTVSVDDSLFVGPAVSPDWERTYVSSGVVSPVHALAVDEGRVRPTGVRRERDPGLAAGRGLGDLLAAQGFSVSGRVGRTTAPVGAAELAAVPSPTVAALVESMLATSDNDLAEALSRLVAHQRGQPATFAGATAATRAVLAEAGVPVAGMDLRDGSGLARRSKVTAETLGRLLALAADARQAVLRPLVTGLPVAGFSGTLAERFTSPATDAAAGLVRAKTGTLTGVASLVGITETGPGRVVVFAVLADEVPPGRALDARAALDRVAADLTAGGPISPPGGH